MIEELAPNPEASAMDATAPSTPPAENSPTENTPLDVAEKVTPPAEIPKKKVENTGDLSKMLLGDSGIPSPQASGQPAQVQAPTDAKMSPQNAAAAAELYVTTIDYLTIGAAKMFLKNDNAEAYRMKKSDEHKLKVSAQKYLETVGDFGSPGFWFFTSTCTVIGTVLYAAYEDKKKQEKANTSSKPAGKIKEFTPTPPAPAPATADQPLDLCEEVQVQRGTYKTVLIEGALYYNHTHEGRPDYIKRENIIKTPYTKVSAQFEKVIRANGINSKGEALEYAKTGEACRSLRDAIAARHGFTIEDSNNFLKLNSKK